MKLNSYKELIVWQKSIELVKKIYEITAFFPKHEQFALASQLRRAAISIPSNIAEGYGRRSYKEYLQFFAIAYGSALEIETQLIITQKLLFASSIQLKDANNLLNEVIKMLYVMVYKKKGVKAEASGQLDAIF